MKTFREYAEQRSLPSRLTASQELVDRLSSDIERLENELMQDGIRERKAFLAGDRKQEDFYWRSGEKKKKEMEYLRWELKKAKENLPSTPAPPNKRTYAKSSELAHSQSRCPCGCGKTLRSCPRKALRTKLSNIERKIEQYKAQGYLPGSRKGLDTALDTRDRLKKELKDMGG